MRLTTNLHDILILWLAQGFGSGRAPIAPGTFGTLPGVILYLAIAHWSLTAYLTATVTMFAIGIFLCDRAAQLLEQEDPPSIVWDEIMGYLITMVATPPNWFNLIVGFALFRLFDIWKPWPINLVDRHVKGGLGIMLDDVMAGLLAMFLWHAVSTQSFGHFWGHVGFVMLS